MSITSITAKNLRFKKRFEIEARCSEFYHRVVWEVLYAQKTDGNFISRLIHNLKAIKIQLL